MSRRTVRTLLFPLALVLAAGCSSSAAKSGSSSSSAAGGATTVAKSAAVSTAAPGTTTAAGATVTIAKGDCEKLKPLIATMSVDWQVLVQLVNATKVSEWNDRAKTIGSLPKFAETLDGLQAAFGSDKSAADSISYMRGANDIVQKGLGGDEGAIASLKTYLGTNLVDSLTKQAAIGKAFNDVGC